MLDHNERVLSGDLPLDFTKFLAARLELDTPTTLAVLGSFLLSFEPKSAPHTPGSPARSALESD